MTHRRHFLVAAAVAMAAPVAFPAEPEYQVRVTFDEHNATRRFDDAIDGFAQVTYIIQLRQGQSLLVSLASNNVSNCFDIYAPNLPKPVYVGGDSGSTHRLLAQVAGEYRVQVFLLRLAARDNQSAQYTLDLQLFG